jgi:hypothetical protein
MRALPPLSKRWRSETGMGSNASLQLTRALIFVVEPVNEPMAQAWAQALSEDEVIILTAAHQNDFQIGRAKVSGNEPRSPVSESLLTHILRALSRRFTMRLGSAQHRDSDKILLARLLWWRPDLVYTNVAKVQEMARDFGVPVFPMPKGDTQL